MYLNAIKLDGRVRVGAYPGVEMYKPVRTHPGPTADLIRGNYESRYYHPLETVNLCFLYE